MADQSVVVVSAGVASPVGLTLAETAASVRARVALLREIEWRDRRFQPYMVGVVPDDGLPELGAELAALPLQYREARMLRLAHLALDEALKPMAGYETAMPLLLGLPEHHTTKPLAPKDFLFRLAQQSNANLDLSRSMAAPNGRAVGLMAIRRAAAMLAAEEAEFMLVGGVDSLVDLYVLGTLDMQERIRNEVNIDGLRPGEGAAFLVLTLASTAANYRLRPLAKLLGSAQGKETGHLYAQEPYLGEGLASTFSALLAEAPPPAPIRCIYASLNGEHYWGKEFGVARLRNSAAFAQDAQIEHPAECFGDLGAAHGVMQAALAVDGMVKGYRLSPCLVYASSDYGDRAAVLLSTA